MSLLLGLGQYQGGERGPALLGAEHVVLGAARPTPSAPRARATSRSSSVSVLHRISTAFCG